MVEDFSHVLDRELVGSNVCGKERNTVIDGNGVMSDKWKNTVLVNRVSASNLTGLVMGHMANNI